MNRLMAYALRVPGWALIVLGAPFLLAGMVLVSIEHRQNDKAAALNRSNFSNQWTIYKLIEWTCRAIGTPLLMLGALVVNAGRRLTLPEPRHCPATASRL
jgi:hypothetical protein